MRPCDDAFRFYVRAVRAGHGPTAARVMFAIRLAHLVERAAARE